MTTSTSEKQMGGVRPEETMSIREKILENKHASVIAALVVIVGALVAIYLQVRTSSESLIAVPGEGFYSADDGATWFTDVSPKIVPFKRGNADAVRAVLFKPDSGGTPFVGYLMRYSTTGHDVLVRAQRNLETAEATIKATPGGGAGGGFTLPVVPYDDVRLQEVKKPGAANPWVPYNDPRAQQILAVKAPDGGAASLVSP